MTDTEKQEIIDAVISQLLSAGLDITGLNSVESLQGISTFPAVLTTTTDGVTTKAIVSVPIALLTQSVQDVITSANTAASSARSAAAGWAAAAVKMGSDIVVIEGDISNLQNADKSISSLTAYAECSTAANVSAKAVTVPFFSLPTNGGCLHVKMANANTAVSGVTLNINATGAKDLFYNGSAVSATNTWEANEILEIYYDGTNYQATNAQGGGGSADRISFDNSQSGLSAENVQEAIDEIVDDVESNASAIEEVRSLIGNVSIKDIYPDLYPSVLYVVDGDGYIGLKLDVNGLDTASISTHLTSLIQDIAGSGSDSGGGSDVTPSDSSTWLKDKRFVAVGDSLSVVGSKTTYWQKTLAEKTGAIFDKNLNDLVSESGAQSLSQISPSKVSDQRRLRSLKELIDGGQYQAVNAIFFMNINNMNYPDSLGTITDTPFFEQKEFLVTPNVNYTSYQQAIANANGSVFPTVDDDKKIGAVGRVKYTSSGAHIDVTLTVTGTAASDTTLTLTVGGSNYGITIISGDTASEIASKIAEYDYGTHSVLLTDSNVVKFSVNDGNASVEISLADNTGVTITKGQVSSGGTSYAQVCFLSRDISQWNNSEAWGKPSLCAVYMGMFEYARNNFPNAYLFAIAPTRILINTTNIHAGNQNYILRADDTFDVYKWKTSSKQGNNVAQSEYFSAMNVLEQACALYGVPFINLMKESNISIYNAASFYPAGGDVHPSSAGHVRWGETIARLIV